MVHFPLLPRERLCALYNLLCLLLLRLIPSVKILPVYRIHTNFQNAGESLTVGTWQNTVVKQMDKCGSDFFDGFDGVIFEADATTVNDFGSSLIAHADVLIPYAHWCLGVPSPFRELTLPFRKFVIGNTFVGLGFHLCEAGWLTAIGQWGEQMLFFRHGMFPYLSRGLAPPVGLVSTLNNRCGLLYQLGYGFCGWLRWDSGVTT
nr:MAG TPA: hypothetical protein [Caudoviricetes sp.]